MVDYHTAERRGSACSLNRLFRDSLNRLFRNLLPTCIEWETLDESEHYDNKNYANLRRAERFLTIGEQAEVYAQRYDTIVLRIRPMNMKYWTCWLRLEEESILFPHSDATLEMKSERSDIHPIRPSVQIKVRDVMGIQLPLGLRIIRKSGGLDVSIYAELWCINATNLNLVFGCPREQTTDFDDSELEPVSESPHLSSAEAALKEILSLFETGYDGAGIKYAER
jgi:hypothetical protein